MFLLTQSCQIQNQTDNESTSSAVCGREAEAPVTDGEFLKDLDRNDCFTDIVSSVCVCVCMCSCTAIFVRTSLSLHPKE